jgi:hypothetical protein
MEALRFSETSALTRSARRNIPEAGMLHISVVCRSDGLEGTQPTSYREQTNKQTKNSVALSPQATATCWRNLVPTFWIEGCRVVRAADPLRSLISVF